MNETGEYLKELAARYPELSVAADDIRKAYGIMRDCFSCGGKMLVAGNGGSCADADHIAGELMKGFCLSRPLTADERAAFERVCGSGAEVADKLQRGLPVTVLSAGGAFGTAFANDIKDGAAYVYAQQVFVLGKKGDVFFAVSTSGNSANIINAAIAAKARGMSVVSLTGASGGKLALLSDAAVKAPETECYKVQEYHLPIYHCLCRMLEKTFFGE